MPVYFDNNATTRLDPRVLEAMLPYLSGPYGNASSLHRFGRAARDAVERAREQLAVLVNCQPREIIWTSGGTESNNLALKGVTDGAVPSRVLYGATEHPAVLEAAESLHERGWIVETVAVDETGVIDWSRLGHQLKAGAVRLVSLMRANNETGVIQDVARAARLVHDAEAWLHVDRSEEHTSELQSLMRISYAVFCLKKKKNNIQMSHSPAAPTTTDKHMS